MAAMNVTKKIAGVVFLVIGGFVLFLGLMGGLVIFFHSLGVAGVSSGKLATLAGIVIILFVPLGVLLILLGNYLWGWMRRRIVFGILLIVIGGFFLLLSLDAFLPGIPTDPSRLGYLLCGIIALPTGIFLVIKQNKIDKTSSTMI